MVTPSLRTRARIARKTSRLQPKANG